MRSMSCLSNIPGVAVSDDPQAREHARVQRVGFFGFFGIGNFGNDGSLEAMLRLLRNARPATDVLCVCGVPAKVGPRFGVRAVRINWRPESQLLRKLDRLLLNIPREAACLIQSMRHISRLDLLIIPGTGILDDFGTGPKGMPYWLFRWCLLARLFGTKIVFVSIGAGPIHHPLSRWLMKSAARMAGYRSYRDEISRDFMKRIGLDVSNDPVYPDVAFGLPEPAFLREPSAEGEPITVGVGVMSYNGWRGDKAGDEAVYQAYLGKLQQFVRWLLIAGHRVRVLTGDASDQRTAETLCQMIQSEHTGPDRPTIIISEPAHSLDDVMAQIADTDVVVATRYHNVVCALKLGRPTLSIGYADKNDVLLAEMGLGEFCQHIEKLDVDLLTEQFQKLAAGRKVYERTMRQTNARFRDTLLHQDALLLNRYL